VRLLEKSRHERNQIEEGIDTSAAQLDRLLTADADFYRWCREHPSPDEDPEDEEDRGRDFLKTLKALNGSYYVEKANYCHEIYQFYRGRAAAAESELAKELGESRYPLRSEEKYTASAQRNRQRAANWIRVEANCLAISLTRQYHQSFLIGIFFVLLF
jgi:hypothetical protein